MKIKENKLELSWAKLSLALAMVLLKGFKLPTAGPVAIMVELKAELEVLLNKFKIFHFHIFIFSYFPRWVSWVVAGLGAELPDTKINNAHIDCQLLSQK